MTTADAGWLAILAILGCTRERGEIQLAWEFVAETPAGSESIVPDKFTLARVHMAPGMESDTFLVNRWCCNRNSRSRYNPRTLVGHETR